MRVILVIVLCLSSGFGQNDVKISDVTENADANSALKANFGGPDSATVKGTTFTNAISVDNDQTGHFTLQITTENSLLENLDASTFLTTNTNPASESPTSVSSLRVNKPEGTSNLSATDEEPKVPNNQLFANISDESTKGSIIETSIPNNDQSTASTIESTSSKENRSSEITTIENEQQVPNINPILRTNEATDESTKVFVGKFTTISDEIKNIDASSSFLTNSAVSRIYSLPDNGQITVGTTESSSSIEQRTTDLTTIENSISSTTKAKDENANGSVVATTTISNESESSIVYLSLPNHTSTTTKLRKSNDHTTVSTTSLESRINAEKSDPQLTTLKNDLEQNSMSSTTDTKEESPKDSFVESTTSEGSENVIVSPSLPTHLSMSSIPDSSVTLEKRAPTLNTMESEQNLAQASTASSTSEAAEQSETDSTTLSSTEGSPTSEESTAFVPTTLACQDADPPFIYYDDYILRWNTNQTSNYCYPDSINLTCTPGYSWVFLSNTTFLDLVVAKVNQPQTYTCKAFITTTNRVVSRLSNTLQIPTGSKSIAPVLNHLTLEWEPPFVNASLIYTININGNAQHETPSDCPGTDSRIIANNSTNVLLKADYYYKINISTSFWQLLVQNFTEFQTESSAPEPPRNVSIDQRTDGYYLNWLMPCQPNGNIIGYRVRLTEHDQKTVEPTTQSFKLTDLKPAKQYIGSIATVGSNNYMSQEVFFNFITDGLPNTPQLSISFQDDTSFTIEWIMPADITNDNKIMTVTAYDLYIDVMGPTYTPGSLDCKQPSPTPKLRLVGSQHSFTFTEAWPSYQYNISLIAYSLTGHSPTGHIEVTTNMSVPEAPVNLNSTTAELTDNNSYPLSISWDDPCKINGEMEGYWLEIKERYTEEDEIHTFFNDTVINRKYNDSFKPSHEYVVSVAIKLIDGTVGPSVKYQFTTDIGYPGLPIFDTTKMIINSHDMTVYWKKPVEKTGPIDLYELTVRFLEPLYEIGNQCPIPSHDPRFSIIQNQYLHTSVDKLQPYSRYELKIRARTRPDRYGNYSVENVTTLETAPENVTYVVINSSSELTAKYNATLELAFPTPCNMYGNFTNFSVDCIGSRNGYKNVSLTGVLEHASYTDYNQFFTRDLSPQFDYVCNLTVNNVVGNSTPHEFVFKSPAGEPNFDFDFNGLPVLEVTPENVHIHLKKSYFESTQADAQYLALVLTLSGTTSYVSYRRVLSTWPSVHPGSNQITPDFWYPFNDTDELDFIVGDGSPMNPALKPDTNYHLSVRVVTDTFYTDSPTLEFTTGSLSKAGVIVGVIFAILILALLGAAGFFVWRRKLHRKFIEKYVRKSVVKPVSLSATAVPVKKFVQYFQSAKNKPELFKQQFMEINDQGKEIQDLHTSNFAKLMENRRKNRYVNILPFDETRVKLLIDEDDEIGSDYVNASYIKGYTGDIEYIATQGPLVSTCRDFWKLVLQENVTIIVMVANFIEKNKEKCHKYFPENHENLIVGDNMEIRCATELHFGTHVVRNLQVRKDCTQVTVTHMQFLEWPDFRVPSGTEHMLQFCYKLRERSKMEGGIMIVHCSAGVGRTGTLIAADMLLQDIAARKPLDVYKTVLDLRKQRCMMVQTEEQYVYLHRLLADHIDRPPTPDNAEAPDPVYENMDMIKRTTNSDYKTSDDEESGF